MGFCPFSPQRGEKVGMRGRTRCLSDDASFSESHILICDAQNRGSAPLPAALRADDLSRT
jgi:hypothetical protein